MKTSAFPLILVLTEQMIMKVNATSTPTRNKSESDGAVSGLLVFGALILGVVILAFLVWVSVKIINGIVHCRTMFLYAQLRIRI